jgi:molybdenum cofactor cytidylyltransferase
MNIGIIILAAGSSTRMGTSKQLLPVDGEPLLLKAAHAALQSRANHVTVVLGSNEKDHRDLLKGLKVDIVENQNWELGIGSSLKTGIKHIRSKRSFTVGVIVMVCDQPAITTKHLNDLIRVYEESGKAIVASLYVGSPGVPALIDKSLFVELMTMEDSYGAKKVIQKHLDKTALVEFDKGAIDIDTPEEYQNYIKGK